MQNFPGLKPAWSGMRCSSTKGATALIESLEPNSRYVTYFSISFGPLSNCHLSRSVKDSEGHTYI